MHSSSGSALSTADRSRVPFTSQSISTASNGTMKASSFVCMASSTASTAPPRRSHIPSRDGAENDAKYIHKLRSENSTTSDVKR